MDDKLDAQALAKMEDIRAKLEEYAKRDAEKRQQFAAMYGSDPQWNGPPRSASSMLEYQKQQAYSYDQAQKFKAEYESKFNFNELEMKIMTSQLRDIPRLKPTVAGMAEQAHHAKCMQVAALLIGDLWA